MGRRYLCLQRVLVPKNLPLNLYFMHAIALFFVNKQGFLLFVITTAIVCACYVLVAIFGFARFGTKVSDNILNNFQMYDSAGKVQFFAVVLAYFLALL